MNSKIIFVLITFLISGGVGLYVFFQEPVLQIKNIETHISGSGGANCEESLSQGITHLSCDDYVIYSREADLTKLKEISHSEIPPNAIIGLLGGKVFDMKYAHITTEEDSVFVINQTPQGLPNITAINSPIQVTLKNTDGVDMTTTFLLPGMSLTHNPQIDMSGADFFRLTQLISFRTLDITKAQWIDAVAPGLNLPDLIASSKKSQDTQLRSILNHISEIVDPYYSLPSIGQDDVVRSTLTFNSKQFKILQEQAIAASIHTMIVQLRGDTHLISSDRLEPIKQKVNEWRAINPSVSEQIDALLSQLTTQSRLQLTRIPQKDSFAKAISTTGQKTLSQSTPLDSKETQTLFQELINTDNPKDFNRGLAELYMISELTKIVDSKNDSSLLLIALKSWITKLSQIVQNIPEEGDKRANLSSLFAQGNDLIAKYIRQLEVLYFVPESKPYRVLDRQKNLTTPLTTQDISNIEECIKVLSSILSITKDSWYTVSDSYDYTTQDPYKILANQRSTLQDLSSIFQNFGAYIQGSFTPGANTQITLSDNDIGSILAQIGISTIPELMDESAQKYRVLDAKSGDNFIYDILITQGKITALSIRETSKNIQLLDTSGQTSLSSLPDFHINLLPRILENIKISPKENEIPLDIGKRSFILDGKTYSF